jgi:AraC-like DNA-binding protein
VLATEPQVAWDVQSPDLARVRREVARFLKPFQLSAHSDRAYNARLVHRRLGRAELTMIEYGDEVAIDAGRITRCCLLQIPLSGSYTTWCDGAAVEVKTNWAHLVRPGAPLAMTWTPDCRVLVLRFDESMMAGRCSGEARLEPFSLDTEPHRSLGRAIDYVAREAIAGRLFDDAPYVAGHAETLLFECLVSALGERLASAHRGRVPEYVRRAERYLLDHVTDESVSIADVASAAVVSTRTLHDGFKRSYGVAPLAWLRAERLERVRRDLLSTRPGEVRVTDVATRWGFQHLGRFCVAYRRRFGETPTQTLQRVPGSNGGITR